MHIYVHGSTVSLLCLYLSVVDVGDVGEGSTFLCDRHRLVPHKDTSRFLLGSHTIPTPTSRMRPARQSQDMMLRRFKAH